MPGKSRALQAEEAAALEEGRTLTSQYSHAFPARATDYCLLGATNDDLARMFNVNVASIELWMREQPRFKRAVDKGREYADAKVARSLYRRALGYKHKETKAQLHEGEWKTLDITKAYPPDTNAAALWLANRQPGKWRSKDAGSGAPTLDLEALLDEVERRREKRGRSLPGDGARAIEAQVIDDGADSGPSARTGERQATDE